LVIINTEYNNQNWLLYKEGLHKILICYQDTYQITYQDIYNQNNNQNNNPNNQTKKTIGWVTAWFETSNIPVRIKENAINLFLKEIHKSFNYIWANSEWIPRECNWKKDGQFHFYTYQWSTSYNLKNRYCITM
jgi:hypothetical protein